MAKTRLYLVRHAQPASGWGEDPDPGLDDTGREQAEKMATTFAATDALPLLTSPLRRARETAEALEQYWRTAAIVESGVGEIPSPTDDLRERRQWLQRALGSTWPALGPRAESWRTMVTELLLGVRQDAVIVTHFVVINVVIGRALDDHRVLCAPVAHAEVVSVDHDGHHFVLVDDHRPGPSADPGPVL